MQLETYLADEVKLYHDWFAIYHPDIDTKTTKSNEFPSVEVLKKRFEIWFESQEKSLRKMICNEWDYQCKQKTFDNKIELIKAIAIDCLAVTYGFSTDNTLTIATILVVDGYMERLCPEPD
ncbi:MAG: hypothetical protein IMF12_04565 [Proteobacteria bacterium]|nr:hypothetical protein [Pseudomonadota bacterium]